MGNYRFKLSELIPNALFHKLRDMRKSTKQQRQRNSTVASAPIKKHQTVLTPTTAAMTTSSSPRLPSRRSSYYSRTDKTVPPDTARKSAGNRLRRRTTPVSSASNQVTSSAVGSRATQQLDFSTTSGDITATGTGSFSPEFRSDQLLIPDESLESSWHSPASCVRSKILPKPATSTPPPALDFRPIIPKQADKLTNVGKTAVSSPAGVRLRQRSPRISTRKSASSGARRSETTAAVSSQRSRAVVKASVDPRRDFKASMEEMIAENNIRGSKDLEELLACYLCLNSDDYHHIIINVFKQIWLDLT